MIFKGSMRILFALFCAKNIFIGLRFSENTLKWPPCYNVSVSQQRPSMAELYNNL